MRCLGKSGLWVRNLWPSIRKVGDVKWTMTIDCFCKSFPAQLFECLKEWTRFGLLPLLLPALDLSEQETKHDFDSSDSWSEQHVAVPEQDAKQATQRSQPEEEESSDSILPSIYRISDVKSVTIAWLIAFCDRIKYSSMWQHQIRTFVKYCKVMYGMFAILRYWTVCMGCMGSIGFPYWLCDTAELSVPRRPQVLTVRQMQTQTQTWNIGTAITVEFGRNLGETEDFKILQEFSK